MASFGSFQSLYQLGAATAIAVQYFYDYQQRISQEVTEELDLVAEQGLDDLEHAIREKHSARPQILANRLEGVDLIRNKLSIATERNWGTLM